LYTGAVEFTKVNMDEIFQLIKLAAELEIPRLAYLCENYLRSIISIERVFDLLKFSNKHGHKGIKEFAVQFAVSKYQDFKENKYGVVDLGVELFQEITELFLQGQKAIVEIKPIPEPPDTLAADFKSIYDKMEGFDASFKLGEELIHCHKGIISAQSEELQQLCQQTPKELKQKGKPTEYAYFLPPLKTKEGVAPGPPISAEAFHSVLRFIYYGEERIIPAAAIELIPFAKDFGLPQLQNVCEKIASFNITKDTALSVLAVTYMPQMDDRDTVAKELKKESINYILLNLDLIDFEELRDMNPEIAIDIVLTRQSIEKAEENKTNPMTLRTAKPEMVLPDLKVPPLKI